MKSLEAINAAIHDGETAPVSCIDDFLEHTTRANFESVFSRLDPTLQDHVVRHAKQSVAYFDDILAEWSRRAARAAGVVACPESLVGATALVCGGDGSPETGAVD